MNAHSSKLTLVLTVRTMNTRLPDYAFGELEFSPEHDEIEMSINAPIDIHQDRNKHLVLSWSAEDPNGPEGARVRCSIDLAQVATVTLRAVDRNPKTAPEL